MKIYTSDHPISRRVCAAVAGGITDSQQVPPIVLLNDTGATYGILRGTGDLINESKIKGQDMWYIDLGYMERSVHYHGDYSGYYRITLNANQCDGTGNHPSDRFDKLHVNIKPWQKTGSKVVIAPISKYVSTHLGIDPTKWLEDTVAKIAENTDREIIIKPKDSDVSLEDTLKDAHCLVAYNSNSLVDAIIAGVPVFYTGDSCCAPVGSNDFTKIEDPYRGDREQWLWNLAYNQFTLPEFRNGDVWEIIK